MSLNFSLGDLPICRGCGRMHGCD